MTEGSGGLESALLANRDRVLRFLEAHGAGDATEDLFQELWMKLSARPSGPVAQPLSYLYRAANNLMLDRYRSHRQARQREREWTEATAGQGDGSSDTPSAERQLIAREHLAQAQAALNRLDPRAAACFRRHRLDGASQKEIANEFGISLSTVEGDLRKAYRAILELRREFE
jgi:RNA polymerase sigma-70 factor (ECF subfamily)